MEAVSLKTKIVSSMNNEKYKGTIYFVLKKLHKQSSCWMIDVTG